MMLRLVLVLLSSALLLSACGSPDSPQSERPPIQKAQKMSTDATQVAHTAWHAMNQLDVLLANQTLTAQQIEEMIRAPIREISTTWRTHVRIADDSVVENDYAMCRKALNDLDIWARQVQNQSKDTSRYQADYQRDKAFCQTAIEQHQQDKP